MADQYIQINSDGTYVWYQAGGKPPIKGKWATDAKVKGTDTRTQKIDGILIKDASGSEWKHNSNEHWGTTPLHAAAHANQAAIAEMLIEHGANVSAQDLNGKTPLHHTTFHKAKAAAKVLQNHGAK